MGLGALLFQPSGIKTRPCLGENSDIREAADFFTDAFWCVLQVVVSCVGLISH